MVVLGEYDRRGRDRAVVRTDGPVPCPSRLSCVRVRCPTPMPHHIASPQRSVVLPPASAEAGFDRETDLPRRSPNQTEGKAISRVARDGGPSSLRAPPA